MYFRVFKVFLATIRDFSLPVQNGGFGGYGQSFLRKPQFAGNLAQDNLKSNLLYYLEKPSTVCAIVLNYTSVSRLRVFILLMDFVNTIKLK